MARLYGGVDGGGTKTLAVIVDEQGREVGRGMAGGSNCQTVGTTEAAGRIAQALLSATGGTLPLEGLFIGLAGVDRPDDRTAMLAALYELGLASPQSLWLGNDAELVLLALPGGTGLGLIAGTGSIALGKDSSGRSVRAGGWGYLIGDEGSGFDLGRKAVQASVQFADGRGPRTSLLPALLEYYSLYEPQQLIGKIYDSDHSVVSNLSGLAPVVFKAGTEGDLVALRLIRRAALDLSKAVEAVAVKLDFTANSPGLALAGSLLLNEPLLRRPLVKHLERSLKVKSIFKVREPARHAARAALAFYGT